MINPQFYYGYGCDTAVKRARIEYVKLYSNSKLKFYFDELVLTPSVRWDPLRGPRNKFHRPQT